MALATKPFQLGREQTHDALKALLNLHPVMAQYVEPNNMQALCMLPICIWAAEKLGEPNCNLRARMLDWETQLRTVRDSELDHCLRALNITYALREEFAEKDLRCLASFWQDDNADVLWSRPADFTNNKLATWCTAAVRLGLLHEHLTAVGIKEGSPGKPSWPLRWSRCAGEAISEMNTEQQARCIEHWTTTPLSPTYILRACRNASAPTWLLDGVQAALVPLLPENELTRWQMLPWTAPESSREASSFRKENQALTRAYCPLASDILEMTTTPEMWDDRKTIGAFMEKFAKNAPAIDQMDDAGALFDMT